MTTLARFLGFLTILVLINGANAQFQPIPPVYDGYSIGTPIAPIWLEAFYDFLCPDSAASWPIIQQVLTNYQDAIWFQLHVFPLPYHHNAFLAAKAGVIVEAYDSKLFWPWVNLIFQNQSLFYTANTTNQTMNQVTNNFGSLVNSGLGIPSDWFINQMNNNETLDENTRIAWKYGAGKGGVFGTPTFFLNGILTQADQTWTLSQWEDLIQQVIGAQDPMAFNKDRFFPKTITEVLPPINK